VVPEFGLDVLIKRYISSRPTIYLIFVLGSSVKTKNALFLDMKPFSLADDYQCFGQKILIFKVEVGGGTFV